MPLETEPRLSGPETADEQCRAYIQILKRARQQIAAVHAALNAHGTAYSTALARDLDAVACKVDEALAWQLLQRELESDERQQGGGVWADLQSETEALDGDQVV